MGQWRPLPDNSLASREAIQSLLAAIPDVPFIRPLPIGARTTSDLGHPGQPGQGAQHPQHPGPLPAAYGTVLTRSHSAPLAGALALSSSASSSSLGGGSTVSWGDGVAAGLQRSLSSSFPTSASAAVIGQSHGIGLNFPYAQLDEMGRREYRRQSVLRWLEKRKRRKTDRGVTYGERSTLALRRQRISGRFVKQNSNFVSVTELERSRALGIKKEGGGASVGGYDEEDHEDDEDEDDGDEDDDDDDEEDGDDEDD